MAPHKLGLSHTKCHIAWYRVCSGACRGSQLSQQTCHLAWSPKPMDCNVVWTASPMLMLVHMLRHMPSKLFFFQIILHRKKDLVEKAVV